MRFKHTISNLHNNLKGRCHYSSSVDQESEVHRSYRSVEGPVLEFRASSSQPVLCIPHPLSFCLLKGWNSSQNYRIGPFSLTKWTEISLVPGTSYPGAVGRVQRAHTSILKCSLKITQSQGLLSFQVKPIGARSWHQAFALLLSWWAFSQCVTSGKSELVTPARACVCVCVS